VHTAQDWVLITGQWELGLRLALALYSFWLIRGSTYDDPAWLERLLAITPDSSEPDHATRRARAIHLLGILHYDASDYAAACRWYETSLACRRALGDRSGEEASLHNLGLLAMACGDPVRASVLAEEAIGICRELGDRGNLAICLGNYADALIALGCRKRAGAVLREAEALFREDPTPRDHAHYLFRLGNAMWWGRGQAETAREYYEQALSHFQQLGDERFAASVLSHLSLIASDADQHPRAARYVAEALTLERATDDRGLVANILDRQAAIAVSGGDPAGAARLLGAADALREALAIVPLPMIQDERDRTVDAVQTVLGEPRTAAFRADGHGLTCQQAISEALRVADTLSEHEVLAAIAEPTTPTVVLTRRERDVLRQLVAGQSDKEIGDALSVGHRTIATHVSNILAKFDVPTRAAAVAHALRHGLVSNQDEVNTSLDRSAADG
ncbi:MAG: LuxR C-terminal-related transcriptional regulator, partial [Thermomicrobiales bacterium]